MRIGVEINYESVYEQYVSVKPMTPQLHLIFIQSVGYTQHDSAMLTMLAMLTNC